MNILISSIGSQNGINLIKALSGYGKLIGCDCDKLSAGLYLVDRHYIVPRVNNQKFIPSILDICNKENINVIFPTNAIEYPVFGNNKTLFRGKIVISDPDKYDLTENKMRCNNFLRNIGIPIPEQFANKFPVIVKPIMGVASKNVYIVKNQRELNFYSGKDTFYEEFIEGTEYTIDGICDLKGNMICALSRIRIEVQGGGATKCITVKNNKLVKFVRKIVESMCLIGAFNIQCIERNGKYYFTDVNNRFPSGGMPLAVASGMNMPLMLIQLLQGKKVKPKLKYGLKMLRYSDSIII